MSPTDVTGSTASTTVIARDRTDAGRRPLGETHTAQSHARVRDLPSGEEIVSRPGGARPVTNVVALRTGVPVGPDHAATLCGQAARVRGRLARGLAPVLARCHIHHTQDSPGAEVALARRVEEGEATAGMISGTVGRDLLHQKIRFFAALQPLAFMCKTRLV